MTGNERLLNSFTKKKGGSVTFSDNDKGKVIGIGQVGSSPSIEHMLLVDGLQHNLISVSQLCDNGYYVIFTTIECLLIDNISHKIIYKGEREGNSYTLSLNSLTPKNGRCLIVEKQDE